MLERSLIGRLRLKRLMRDVDRFAVISGEIDAELASYAVPAGRRHFIPNGVDLSRFQPADPLEKAALRENLGLPAGPIGLFAGRLEGEKRIDRLVALWPQVRMAVPTATLVVAGAGQLADALISARVDGVRIVGPQSDLRDWYAAADVFILPSEAEGLSNAMLEALASGLPCVATRVGAAPELLSGGLGLLVEVDDDAALVAATVAALRGLPGHSAEQARQTIIRDYDISETASRLAALYHDLAAKSGAR